MKNKPTYYSLVLLALGMLIMCTGCNVQNKALQLTSDDDTNTISLSLDAEGKLSYTVTRGKSTVIANAPMGLVCEGQDFSKGLTVAGASGVEETREQYELKVANNKTTNHILERRSITFKNANGALMIIDLVAAHEGVAFRYRFADADGKTRVVKEELTGFSIEKSAEGWLQPYNKAGDYTPGYEDFYVKVAPGDAITGARNASVGWCMPALFNVNNKQDWVLIAESGNDGFYPGCHLQANSVGGVYKIAFAERDEKYTLPLADKPVYPESKLPWAMPWRVIVIGGHAGDILLSTLITDLAPASKIADTSWITPGKASWSWWSHPDDHDAGTYNQFTDLGASFGFEYTLFDAGWEKANQEGKIIDYATSKGIKPLVWGYSSEYFDPVRRKKRFKELAAMGIKGVKIDFWCSDRQEVMAALQGVFEDAANEHLLVNLHGTTMPRGWHRTWPNYMTAEGILGTESYFYEPRFPELAAQQNTVLPFTRNVAGPADYTPFALTMRKFPRLNTGVHELATAMTYTSGIIHFADSREMFDSLPAEVKQLLKEMPATWDKTESIIADPGTALVLHRQKGQLSYIVGINGTNTAMPITLDLAKYGKGYTKFRIIKEGQDPLMDFETKTYPVADGWAYSIAPKGGFIIRFIK